MLLELRALEGARLNTLSAYEYRTRGYRNPVCSLQTLLTILSEPEPREH